MNRIDQERKTPLRDLIYTATEVIKFQAKRIGFRVALLKYEMKIKSKTESKAVSEVSIGEILEEMKIQFARTKILRDLMQRITERAEYCGRVGYPMHN